MAQAGAVTMATAIASAIAKVFIRDSFHDKMVNGWYLNPQLNNPVAHQSYDLPPSVEYSLRADESESNAYFAG